MKNSIIGNVPPSNVDAENAIIGAILIEKSALSKASEIVKPVCFYSDSNSLIFSTFLEMNQKGVPIDQITLISELTKKGILEKAGGAYEIIKKTNDVISGANLENHARLVVEAYLSREMLRIGLEMMNKAYNSLDVFDQFDFAERSIHNLSSTFFKSDFKKLGEGIPDLIERMERLANRSGGVTGVNTGYENLNEITGGWQETDLIIIAARPSVGKTVFALNLAVNASKNYPVGFFSLEMSHRQLLERVMSMDSRVHMKLISRGRVNVSDLADSISNVSNMNIYLDDDAGINIYELRAKARRMVQKYGVRIIFIDYVQLMKGDRGDNREQQLSNISRELKIMAKDLKIPVVALSQLNRMVEPNKEPSLSNLRETGALEQDADLIGFIWIGEDSQGKECRKVKIAKHRNGSLQTFDFNAANEIQKWEEIGISNTFKSTYKPFVNEGEPF